MSRSRILHITREVLLTSTAVLGALGVLLMALAFALGIHPLLFKSGSMSPTIDTGDLAFARTVDARGLHRGDIVSLVAPSGERVTHRVVDNTGAGVNRKLTLKGDANQVIDPQAYDATSVQKVFAHVPKVGYVVNWLSQAPGVYLVAAYVALMLLLIGRKTKPKDSAPTNGSAHPADPVLTSDEDVARPVLPQPAPGRRRRRGRSRVVLASAVAMTAAVAALSAWSMPTWAAWTDPVAVTGQSVTTGSWNVVPVAPVITSCTNAGGSDLSLVWTWPTAANGSDPTTGFEVRNSKAQAARAFGPGIRNNSTSKSGYNNFEAEVWIVALNGTTVSADSAHYFVHDSGNNKTCTLVP